MAAAFLQAELARCAGVAASVPGGAPTLYGTCYALMGLHFLGVSVDATPRLREFLLSAQDSKTGLFVRPELEKFEAEPGAKHDREHLSLHLTCTALPVLQHYELSARSQIFAAHRFCDLQELTCWLDARDLRSAWFEGNNILFVGQLLVYLRDVEARPDAAPALDLWFDWLNEHVDPKTGLWGTDGYCSPMEAVYGGYHQLLVYHHERRALPNLEGLVDTVLALQHLDGGFHPGGNGGACEDVDSVDILVNCYKRRDYRRAEIRYALRRCVRHILRTQNEDGGFPYSRDTPQSHMGIPGTSAGPNVSCTFPTWFRIHTLALAAEVLPNEPTLAGIPFRFSRAMSMGWHSSPPDWQVVDDSTSHHEWLLELRQGARAMRSLSRKAANKAVRIGRGALSGFAARS